MSTTHLDLFNCLFLRNIFCRTHLFFYFNTLAPISLEGLVSISHFHSSAWCSSDKEAEHFGLLGLAVTVDCDKLDVIHGVIGQPLHGVPAALGQRASVCDNMSQVAESGACVTDDNLLVPVLVRGSQLKLKIYPLL